MTKLLITRCKSVNNLCDGYVMIFTQYVNHLKIWWNYNFLKITSLKLTYKKTPTYSQRSHRRMFWNSQIHHRWRPTTPKIQNWQRHAIAKPSWKNCKWISWFSGNWRKAQKPDVVYDKGRFFGCEMLGRWI